LVRGRIHPLAGYNAIGHYYVGKVTDPTRCRGTQLILSEPMTWSEICARYPDEWVCFVEIARVDEHSFEFTTARLVSHAKDRDDAHDQAGLIGLHYDGVGYRFTGKDRRAAQSVLGQPNRARGRRKRSMTRVGRHSSATSSITSSKAPGVSRPRKMPVTSFGSMPRSCHETWTRVGAAARGTTRWPGV
jgi:hypothetical protein